MLGGWELDNRPFNGVQITRITKTATLRSAARRRSDFHIGRSSRESSAQHSIATVELNYFLDRPLEFSTSYG